MRVALIRSSQKAQGVCRQRDVSPAMRWRYTQKTSGLQAGGCRNPRVSTLFYIVYTFQTSEYAIFK